MSTPESSTSPTDSSPTTPSDTTTDTTSESFQLIASDGSLEISREMALQTLTAEQLDSHLVMEEGGMVWRVDQPLEKVRPVNVLEEILEMLDDDEDEEDVIWFKEQFPSQIGWGPIQKYHLGIPIFQMSWQDCMVYTMYFNMQRQAIPGLVIFGSVKRLSITDSNPGYIAPEWLTVAQVMLVPEADYHQLVQRQSVSSLKSRYPVVSADSTSIPVSDPESKSDMEESSPPPRKIPFSWYVSVLGRILLLHNEGTVDTPVIHEEEVATFTALPVWLFLPPKDIQEFVTLWETHGLNKKEGEEFFKIPPAPSSGLASSEE